MLATQNPVEQEGTYPLPEAQLDRFMFLIELDYPSEAEEIQIARTTTGEALPRLEHLMTPAGDHPASEPGAAGAGAGPHLFLRGAAGAQDPARAARPRPAWLKPLVSWGAGPRAVQYLILGAKARAALLGSYMVRLEDIQEVGRAGADAPHHHHLRRPGRGDRRQEDRPAADRRDRRTSRSQGRHAPDVSVRSSRRFGN